MELFENSLQSNPQYNQLVVKMNFLQTSIGKTSMNKQMNHFVENILYERPALSM